MEQSDPGRGNPFEQPETEKTWFVPNFARFVTFFAISYKPKLP